MYIDKLRYRSYKVLPLAYDESLSYYEVLNKVRDRLNKVIEVVNITDEEVGEKVTEILTEWKTDGTLEALINEQLFERYNQFYIPEDFGGVGDGSTDCTDAFDKACKAMYSGDIKVLYIPKGTYLIKNSIAIPTGCMLVGSGKESIIYYDETVQSYGVGITTGGDNVVIANLCINHKTTTTPIPYDEAIAGALAVGNIECIGVVEAPASQYARVTRRNVIVDNIWCTQGRYAFQCENYRDSEDANDIGRILENVYVNNIFAPNSMVSVAPKDGNMRNVSYKNIKCDIMRVGAYSGYYGENINVSDFYCKYLHVRAYGCNISNGFVDCRGNTLNSSANAVDLISGNKLYNIRVVGGNTQYQNCVLARGTDRRYFFSGCEFSGFTRFWYNSSGNSLSQPADLIGCVVSQNSSSTAAIQGCAIGGDFGVAHPQAFKVLPE